jgi:UDP-glucuronate decarboxylase
MGNPTEFTMNTLANLVLDKVGGNSTIKKLALPQDDPKQRKPDISRIKSALNWEPSISLETGLDYTIEYFRNVLNE